MMRCVLGDCLEAKGRHAEAIAEYRQTLALDPKLTVVARNLRASLIRWGRAEEARADWKSELADNPPDHEIWYGYAEFCLFLGNQDEYRQARRALLSTFGGSTHPYVAERTARACLLLARFGRRAA